MKSRSLSLLALVLFQGIFATIISAQETQTRGKSFELDTRIFGAGGYEFNPYESPDTLYDYRNKVGYNESALLKPDYFLEYGYNLDISKAFKDKFLISLASNLKNRNYSRETILNTALFNIGITPAFIINKWLKVGFGYEFERRSLVDADITGEQTKYVLAYQQHAGQAFIKTRPFRGNITNLYYIFTRQNYSTSYTIFNELDSLDHIFLDNDQHTLDLRMIQTINSRSSLQLKVIAYDRQYVYLPSYDSLAHPNYSEPRHYMDLNARLQYNHKFNNYLEIKPYVRYERKKDMYGDYYSYNQYEGGLQIGLFYRKFELDLTGWYEFRDYDRCEAPVETKPYPVLRYDDFNGRAGLTYKVANGVEITASAYKEIHQSNADRVTWIYRRGYDNLTIKAGIVLMPDKWLNLGVNHRSGEEQQGDVISTDQEIKPDNY